MRLFKSFILLIFSARLPARLVIICLLVAPLQAQAKDLSGRLGVGFNNEFANSTWAHPVPAFSLKYGMTRRLHVSGALGFDTASPSDFTLGTKVYENIFFEPNMNFYGAGGLAYLKSGRSGFEVLGVLGGEFFIPGLDSLGFLFEAGVSGSNITGSFALKTVGFTFIQAGMHFYF